MFFALGDEESLDFEEGLSGGLFLDTLENLVFALNPEIASLAKQMPKNAKYISADVQNEFVEVMAQMVRDVHAARIKLAELYTIMVDGTTDKSNEEVQGLVTRYFCLETYQIEERALNVDGSGRSAKEIFDFVKKTLDACEISFDGLVSQSYDGASVMKGDKGGLQALINIHCGRIIAYIHCYCHRLHLVVVDVMKNIVELDEYFGTVSGLYKFFKLAGVKEQYEGGSLKRLIDTRWSGHFASCKAINDNYGDIVQTLMSATTLKKLDATQRATAAGLWSQAIADEFIFLGDFVQDVLKDCDLAMSAIASITMVRDSLKEKREEYTDEKINDMSKKKKKHGKTITSNFSSS